MSTPHSSSMSDDTATVPSAWPFGPLLGFDTETTGVDPSGTAWSRRRSSGGRSLRPMESGRSP